MVINKAQQAKTNRNKGHSLEREVVKSLVALGYDVTTSRFASKITDDMKIDIFDKRGDLPTNIQVKYLHSTPAYFTIREECPDKSKPFTIIWKKSQGNTGKHSPGSIAMVDLDFFYQLLKEHHEYSQLLKV